MMPRRAEHASSPGEQALERAVELRYFRRRACAPPSPVRTGFPERDPNESVSAWCTARWRHPAHRPEKRELMKSRSRLKSLEERHAAGSSARRARRSSCGTREHRRRWGRVAYSIRSPCRYQRALPSTRKIHCPRALLTSQPRGDEHQVGCAKGDCGCCACARSAREAAVGLLCRARAGFITSVPPRGSVVRHCAEQRAAHQAREPAAALRVGPELLQRGDDEQPACKRRWRPRSSRSPHPAEVSGWSAPICAGPGRRHAKGLLHVQLEEAARGDRRGRRRDRTPARAVSWSVQPGRGDGADLGKPFRQVTVGRQHGRERCTSETAMHRMSPRRGLGLECESPWVL